MNTILPGEVLANQAVEAYRRKRLDDAVRYAEQALDCLSWDFTAEGYALSKRASAVLVLARRELNTPNPSWLRRVFWAFTGPSPSELVIS